jgi:hypothetical protein
VIVRFQNALFVVIHQPKHARLFDRRPDQRNRFEQRHSKPLWRVGRKTYFSGNRSGQNAAHRGPADLKPAGDFSPGDAGAMQLADLGGVQSRRNWPIQLFAVQPSLRQSGARPVTQDLTFELGEDGQQTRHGTTGRSCEIQRLGQRDETDTEMLQFLQGGKQICYGASPAIEPPHQNHVDFTTARGFDELFTSLSLDSAGTDITDLQGDRPAASCNVLPQRTYLHRERLLIVRRNARVQTGAQHFRRSSWLAENVSGFRFAGSPFYRHSDGSHCHGHIGSFPAMSPSMILRGHGGCFAPVVPRHPL